MSRITGMVGSPAQRPMLHFIQVKFGASGAVATDTANVGQGLLAGKAVYQGGGLSLTNFVRTSAGLYTGTFAQPMPFYKLGVFPKYHKVAVGDATLDCAYVPGSFVTTNGVTTFQIRFTGPTAANDVTPVVTDPVSGGELHIEFVECYSEFVKPRPS